MNRTRPKQVVIRMSDEEYKAIKAKIEASGLSQQEYLIRAATDAPIINTDGIKQLLPQLSKVGNNLNQIAAALNATRYYQYNLITQNQKELNEIWVSLKQYLQKLR